jgi:hypothetical protein
VNGNAIAADRRNVMRKKQQELEEMQMRQQNAKKMFTKMEEPPQQPRQTAAPVPKVNGVLSNGTAAKVEPSKRRLEMNASLDEMAEQFEQSLQIEQQQRPKGQPPPAIKLVPDKENISNGVAAAAEEEEEAGFWGN